MEGYLTLAIDNQWVVFGILLGASLMLCAFAYRTTHLAAVPLLLPIAWVVTAYLVGDAGLVRKQRVYCRLDGGFSHAAIARWPGRSYAICRDGVGEDWHGTTYYVREKGVFGTPIAKLKQY